jgi:hypothetical protein
MNRKDASERLTLSLGVGGGRRTQILPKFLRFIWAHFLAALSLACHPLRLILNHFCPRQIMSIARA